MTDPRITPSPTPAPEGEELEDLERDVDEGSIEQKEVAGLSQSQIVRRRFFRHKAAMISLIVMILILILVTTSIGWGPIPGWWKYGYEDPNPIVNGGRPTLQIWPFGNGFSLGEHPFGQPEVGQDMFARVMRGTQQSLTVMLIVGILATVIGVVIGAIAGFYRGAADSVLMRFTDLIITIPVIVIGAVLGFTYGSLGAVVLAIVLGLFSWTGLARLVRGEFLSLREREFVDAARVAGASNTRIMFKHILPNAVGVIIVNTTLLMSSAILLETALSFLGFGIRSPDISLGQIISEYQASFNTRPWLFWWPGLFIVVIALCVNFIGDGLRDAFDPRQKRIPKDRQLAKARAEKAKSDAMEKSLHGTGGNVQTGTHGQWTGL